MFIHSVYFWLRDDISEKDRALFFEGLASLIKIKTVKQAYIGKPASTDRPVIERGYDCSLIVHFDNKADHDFYQEVESHEIFRQQCSGFWSDVKIYDCLV